MPRPRPLKHSVFHLALPALLLSVLSGSLRAVGPADSMYRERWVYCSTNLLVDANVDRTVELISRAAKSGYTGIMLSDYKFQILDRMDERYFRNAERVKAAAARASVEIIPAVFSVGYSNGILAHDPNLAEGVLAARVPHLVRDGTALLQPVPGSHVKNGDFEHHQADKFAGFSFQDDPGRSTFADNQESHSGRGSLRIEPGKNNEGGGNARVIQNVPVRPHACYRLSCWVKTRDLTSPGSFHIMARGAKEPGRSLTFLEGGAEPTQEWKRIGVVFSSLDETAVNLYAGFWGQGAGTLWIDDLQIEEVSLLNVLRRKGCPLQVTSADGKTLYTEGRDFAPITDPKLGQVPFAGEFDDAHEGPAIRIPARSRIEAGQTILVSWYHPVLTHGSQVMCCLAEPAVETILNDQARRVNAVFHPRTFFMSHDEIRVANWCQACQSRKLSPGGLLAENARHCVAMLKTLNPRARIVVWSDMFDPHHNAVDGYYLVNGSLKGSWEGLSSDVIIANWNSGKARESLEWFAGRGHRQIIAGYYDAGDLDDLERWKTAARGLEGVFGFMYTTWQEKFELLDKYGAALRASR